MNILTDAKRLLCNEGWAACYAKHKNAVTMEAMYSLGYQGFTLARLDSHPDESPGETHKAFCDALLRHYKGLFTN